MRCLRHKIHLNLFLSLLTANLAWVLSFAVQVQQGSSFAVQFLTDLNLHIVYLLYILVTLEYTP